MTNPEENRPLTIEEVKATYCRVFHMPDDTVLDLVLATTIATFAGGDPIWLLIVGSSSGGKSEIVNSLYGISFVHEVSELTENTLLSGMNTKGEASLLNQIGERGVIAMKDFTSIISMRDEKREVILSQMRHVYDGFFQKKTGNGANPSWLGKINFIGGVTEAIYAGEEESASMGRRNVHYVLPDQDRRETTRIARKNRKAGDIKEKRTHIQKVFAEYVDRVRLAVMQETGGLPDIGEEMSEKIITLADFATHARTPTTRDFKGHLTLVISKEMPMRMSEQLHMLSEMIAYMYGGAVPPAQQRAIFKIALDSIPKQKRLVLRVLSQYRTVSTRACATAIGYPTETVARWLEDLTVLGLARRIAVKSGSDKWQLFDEPRAVMVEFDGVVTSGDNLFEKDDEAGSVSDDIDPGLRLEENRRVQAAWDAI